MWIFYVVALIAVVAAYALAPKPKQINPAIQDIKLPTAEEGIEIPVLFGTRKLSGGNVLWYGDVSTTPIKSGGGGKK